MVFDMTVSLSLKLIRNLVVVRSIMGWHVRGVIFVNWDSVLFQDLYMSHLCFYLPAKIFKYDLRQWRVPWLRQIPVISTSED
jgi:hypothetical protein